MTLPSTNTVADQPEPLWYGIEIESCPACRAARVAGEACSNGCAAQRRRLPGIGIGRSAGLIDDAYLADSLDALERGLIRGVALA